MRRAFRPAVLVALFAAFAACGPDTSGPAINQGPMHQAFENAAIDSGVPMDLLLALGWQASHWIQIVPSEAAADPSIEGGHGDGAEAPPHYGVMQLSQDGDDTLDLAAQLEGVDATKVEQDAAANILGAALVLRRYADEMYPDQDIASMDLFGWRDVVARWTGLSDDPEAAYDLVDQVYAIMRDGVGRTLPSGEVLELLPNPGLGQSQDGSAAGSSGMYGQTSDPLTGYSGAHWNPASPSNYSVGRFGDTVHYLVIHTMEGSYESAINWFKNPASQVSAHYLVRSHDGDLTQMVDEANTAWHTGYWDYNKESVGIEHEGYMEDPSWFTDAMYRSSARLACDVVRRWHIPIDRQHIIGHYQVPGCPGGGGGGVGCHRDPGPHWNWTYYLALIQQCVGGGSSSGGSSSGGSSSGGSSGGSPAPHPGNGTIEGVVYANGNVSNRVAGAHIRLSDGRTATAASNGYWSLKVPAGVYTVTASASGYQDGHVTRTVTEGGETWASCDLKQGSVAAEGRVAGVVYVAGNSTERVGGASVTVGGHETTTDSNGRFAMDVAAGTLTVSVSANGYESRSLSVSVPAGVTQQVDVALTKKSAKPGTVDGDIYDLANAAKRIAGASVELSNGTRSFLATSSSSGGFELTNVPAGEWTLSASAPGYGSGSKTVAVSGGAKLVTSLGLRPFKSAATGTLVGVIYEAPDSMQRIAGATVQLSNGQHATTGSDGFYSLPALGRVTAVANAKGFQSGSVTRTVGNGWLIWGSIGLVHGNNVSGSAIGECKPDGSTHHEPYDPAEPVDPIHGETVGTTPTLQFQGIADPTASYIIELMPGTKGAKPIEWKVGPVPDNGNTAATRPPKALPSDGYAWTVMPLWPDCKTDPPDQWGFFIAQ